MYGFEPVCSIGHKKGRNLITGRMGDSGEGSNVSEWSVSVFWSGIGLAWLPLNKLWHCWLG